MTTIESALQKLRKANERITPVTQDLLGIFFSAPKPLSSQDILKALAKKGKVVNKTTVYRQIDKFLKHGIIFEVRFQDRNVRYEISNHEDHHHHLVCMVCGNVQDVRIPADLEKQEKEILRKNKFKVERHFLEFFGLCAKCQKLK